MKKKYNELEFKICLIEFQDIVTTSVMVEWDEDWKQENSNDYIFG